MKIKSEDATAYQSGVDDDQAIIDRALKILESRMRQPESDPLTSPSNVVDWLKLKLGTEERERFYLVLLDVRHRVVSMQCLFSGTVDGASVYPREVVKMALKHNAAAAIIAHNHPSGLTDPSAADRAVTRKISNALSAVDIMLLDHIVIGGADSLSFSSQGLEL